MKKFFMFALAAVSMASCTNDEFLGEGQGQGQNTTGAILFGAAGGQKTQKGTKHKANHVGADAATLLSKEFTVEGCKTTGSPAAAVEVFDDYLVKWAENTAGTTESNTSDWEYVGVTAVKPSSIAGNKQSIKYWDYTATQYDFAAYSIPSAIKQTTGDTYAAGKALVSAIDYENLTTAAYTIKGNTEALKQCYISDLVTAYYPTKAGEPEYQDEVQFVFRNLASKVRVALYETIPGYSVRDVKFYTVAGAATPTDLGTASATSATLFTTGTTPADKFFTEGTYTVKFPTIGASHLTPTKDEDYNKAHVAFVAETTGATTTQEFGALQYSGRDYREAEENSYLGRTSATATFAGTGEHWTTVLPNETGTVLELRVDYTLVSIDGSDETIKVSGATAYVPAVYAAWKPNYAYTYIFKISDNTNGWTSTTATDPKGLYPITFDAVVEDAVEGAEQTTITTVATPSITTYQKGHLYTVDNEYSAAKGKIYVEVMENGVNKDDLNTKGKLYTLNAYATEADVLAAMNLRAIDGSAATIVGRNGVQLTNATSTPTTDVPGVDGNTIHPAANTTVEFTPAAGTYAYVYTVTDPSATKVITTAVEIAEDFDFDGAEAANSNDVYYTDEACTIKATGTAPADGVYYQKYLKNNGVYAVKVIKVVA